MICCCSIEVAGKRFQCGNCWYSYPRKRGILIFICTIGNRLPVKPMKNVELTISVRVIQETLRTFHYLELSICCETLGSLCSNQSGTAFSLRVVFPIVVRMPNTPPPPLPPGTLSSWYSFYQQCRSWHSRRFDLRKIILYTSPDFSLIPFKHDWLLEYFVI